MKNLKLTFVLLIASFTVAASPILPETRAKLQSLRTAIRGWAPYCHGELSNSRECNQFDSMELAGYRCLTGDLERCEDIKKAQDDDGRWWRAEDLIGRTRENSFSRDMKTGLMFYFSVTKDKDALVRWVKYIEDHKDLMCDDADDNRCNPLPGGWTMLGYLYEYLGLKPSKKMLWWRKYYGAEEVISAKTAPKGFPLMLIANNLFFLRKIGIKKKWMNTTIDILNHRQPHNPMLQYLKYGATESWAQTILANCPVEPSERMDDFFWQRELELHDGQLYVIRDWGGDNGRIAVRRMADGHDCLVLLNLALN